MIGSEMGWKLTRDGVAQIGPAMEASFEDMVFFETVGILLSLFLQ